MILLKGIAKRYSGKIATQLW